MVVINYAPGIKFSSHFLRIRLAVHLPTVSACRLNLHRTQRLTAPSVFEGLCQELATKSSGKVLAAQG